MTIWKLAGCPISVNLIFKEAATCNEDEMTPKV